MRSAKPLAALAPQAETLEPPNEKPSRLVLGTAQLGMAYGIANTAGRPDPERARGIVETALRSGILEFDTAQAYGESEAVLGRALAVLGSRGREAKIITKIAPEVDPRNEAALARAIAESLARLGRSSLYGLMLHREQALALWENGLGDFLRRRVQAGEAARLGVSVYSPAAALLALDTPGIDFVQIPSNLFDRRFEEAGLLEEAEKKGKELYIRSVFLQGLLLMEPERLPGNLLEAKPLIARLREIARSAGVAIAQLALGYVKSVFPGQGVLIGCETREQLLENLRFWEKPVPSGLVAEVRREFAHVPERIVNPLLWSGS